MKRLLASLLALPLAVVALAAPANAPEPQFINRYFPAWDEIAPINITSDFYGGGKPTLAQITVEDFFRTHPHSRLICFTVDGFDKFVLTKQGDMELNHIYCNNVIAGGNILVDSPWKALGYAGASGGKVSQAYAGASVTLDRPSGTITTAPVNILPGGIATFTFVNSMIQEADTIQPAIRSSSGVAVAYVTGTQAGKCQIAIQNLGKRPLAGPVSINFALIKGVN